MDLTPSDIAAWEALSRRGNLTPTELAEEIWPNAGEFVIDGTVHQGRRSRQCYARPAGKILHRLKRMRLAARIYHDKRLVWVPCGKLS